MLALPTIHACWHMHVNNLPGSGRHACVLLSRRLQLPPLAGCHRCILPQSALALGLAARRLLHPQQLPSLLPAGQARHQQDWPTGSAAQHCVCAGLKCSHSIVVPGGKGRSICSPAHDTEKAPTQQHSAGKAAPAADAGAELASTTPAARRGPCQTPPVPLAACRASAQSRWALLRLTLCCGLACQQGAAWCQQQWAALPRRAQFDRCHCCRRCWRWRPRCQCCCCCCCHVPATHVPPPLPRPAGAGPLEAGKRSAL